MDEVRCKRSFEFFIPIQILHPFIECWITVSNCIQITFEMRNVNWIESNDGDEESNICFCDLITKEKWSRRSFDVSFHIIERIKKNFDSFFVWSCCGSESRLVNSIVDIVVYFSIHLRMKIINQRKKSNLKLEIQSSEFKLAHLINLFSEFFRININLSKLLWQ